MRIVIAIDEQKIKAAIIRAYSSVRFVFFAAKAVVYQYRHAILLMGIVLISVAFPIQANRDYSTMAFVDFDEPVVETSPGKSEASTPSIPSKPAEVPPSRLDEGKIKRHKRSLKHNNYGQQIGEMNEDQLRSFMYDKGYTDLDGYNKSMLRRMYLAHEYDALFWDVHDRTGFPISMVFAFFIYEATKHGIETDLWSDHWNAGGLKYCGKGSYVYRYDDCFDRRGKKIPCKFQSHDSYQDAVDAMAATLNKDRYFRCKTYRSANDICKCMYESGYSTGNNWKARAIIMRQYWELRKHFPNN